MAAAPLFPIALPSALQAWLRLAGSSDLPWQAFFKGVEIPAGRDIAFSTRWFNCDLKTEDWPYNFGGLGCFDFNVYINWKIPEGFLNWNRCKNRLCFLERRGLDSVVFGRCWKFKIETVGVQMVEDSYVSTLVETACWLSMNSLKGDFLATIVFKAHLPGRN